MVHSGYLTKENISIQTINCQIKIPGEQSKKEADPLLTCNDKKI